MKENLSLKDVTKVLVAVAMGRIPAETVIKNATLINVNTAEFQEGMDIAIHSGRICLVGDASHTIGELTRVIDGTGKYASPGFMDGHIHVESSMLTVRNYAKAVLPHGTTTIYADPHEIANVCGTEGVTFMIENGKDIPLRFYVAMPSCVPAVVAFEDAGATLEPEDIAAFMKYDSVCGLGELMNFPGVLAGEDKMHAEIYATLHANKTITGHYSVPDTGAGLNAYIATGVRCCHESTREEDALEKMRRGMYAQFREGSAWHDLKEVAKSVTNRTIDSRFATLVSDDTHPHTLIEDGHLDHIVRRAIEEGINPIEAIQMVTINVAQCFQMDRDLGSISPSKCADILLISDLNKMTIDTVISNGEVVAKQGEMTVVIEDLPIPDIVLNTMHVKELSPSDFDIFAPTNASGTILTNVMEIEEAKVGTFAKQINLPIIDGFVNGLVAEKINKVAVIERHHYTGTIGKGFVKGFGIQNGAVASTVAHDAHNLLVVGDNSGDMALAANALREVGGGMVAVQNGKVLSILPLPIAGLMTQDSAEVASEKIAQLDDAWVTLGCSMVSPFMTMALLSLAVLPELRLTNRGLIDTINYQFTSLFPEDK